MLDWKGLGREGGWVEGGIIYVPAARWSWSPRPPATQLCCAASHQQFHQHQHQHQRQGIYACTLMSSNVNTDLFAWMFGFCGIWNHWQTFIFATGQPMKFFQIICKTRGGYTGPSPFGSDIQLRSVARISCPTGPSPFATGQPMRIIRIFSHRNH